jgi:hypothetical protein
MSTKTQILRKDNLFLNPITREIIEQFPSVSKAKRESRIRQAGNGGLGRGYVQVIDTRDKRKLPVIVLPRTAVLFAGKKEAAQVVNRLSIADVNRLVSILNTQPKDTVVAKRIISRRVRKGD